MTTRTLALAALVSTICAPQVVHADLGLGEGRQFPYQGHLQRNGSPVTGSMDIRFALSTSDATPMDCLVTETFDAGNPPPCGLWWEERPAVAVTAGQFSVVLGEVANLSDAVFAQSGLFLAIAIQDPSVGPGYTLLPTRQKIHAVPFANRGVSALDYEISGELVVGGGADVGGDAFVGGNATIGGDATVTQALSAGGEVTAHANANPLRITNDWQDFNAGGANRAEISNDVTTYHSLMLLGNSTSGVRRVSIWDDLFVNGAVEVNGDVTGLTATSTNCSNHDDNNCEVDGGDLIFLDRANNVSCPTNKFMVSWDVLSCNSGNGFRMRYRCCTINVQ